MSRRIKPKEKYARISNERNWAQFGRSAERGKKELGEFLEFSRPKVV